MGEKSIFASRTFWTNILAPAFLFVGARYGLDLEPESQAAVVTTIMAAANVGLRFVTTQPVGLTSKS